MATRNRTYRLTDEDLELQDRLAREIGVSKNEVVRRAVSRLAEEWGAYSERAERVVEGVKGRFHQDAVLAIQLDARFDAYATVDGERVDDFHLPTRVLRFQGAAEDFVEVYLGDPESDVRISLGLLPARAGVPLSFPLGELEPRMNPKPVAYYP